MKQKRKKKNNLRRIPRGRYNISFELRIVQPTLCVYERSLQRAQLPIEEDSARWNESLYAFCDEAGAAHGSVLHWEGR